MLKKRFGEDFHNAIASKLEVKTAEVYKKGGDFKNKRRDRGDGRRDKDSRPRQPREKKEGEGDAAKQQPEQKAKETKEEKPAE